MDMEAEIRRLRIKNDPALAHLAEPEPTPEPQDGPEDIWKMTPHEERTLVECGTLAEWAQDALRRSLLDEDQSATQPIYERAGMVQDELGIWDYDDYPPAPQDSSESQGEASVDPYEGLTEDEIKDILLREYRAKTGRY